MKNIFYLIATFAICMPIMTPAAPPMAFSVPAGNGVTALIRQDGTADFGIRPGPVTYDKAGNVSRIGTLSVTYDKEGRVSRVGNAVVTYGKDGRVERVGSTTIVYDKEGRISKLGTAPVQYNRDGTVRSMADNIKGAAIFVRQKPADADESADEDPDS